MNALFYNCFAGIAGDMNLGAMIDLGVPVELLTGELKKLQLPEIDLTITREKRKAIEGTRVKVTGYDKQLQHRHLNDIEQIISHSSLSSFVKKRSLSMFVALAEAEARVHGIAVDKIHFHEVGAADSIADIVGAAICIEILSPEMIFSSAVELGQGIVICDHGTFPVPAPATARLVEGMPVTVGHVLHEATTPTGAVILKEFVDKFSAPDQFRILKTGYGVGSRDDDFPNILRVMAIDTAEPEMAVCTMLECNIDDMNPEFYEYVTEKLFAAGADDVFISNLIMKKARPGVKLSVLCSNALVNTIRHILYTETTTLGVRSYQVEKSMLSRSIEMVNTCFGEVPVKIAFSDQVAVNVKPEFSDCMRIAREFNIPLKDVYFEVLSNLKKLK